MSHTLTTVLCSSVAALGLTLASPQTSHAQVPLGVQVGVGPVRFSYQQGYGYPGYPGYAVPAPVYTAPAVVPAVPPATVYAAPAVVPATPYIGGSVYYGRPYYRGGYYYHHHHGHWR